GIPSSATATGPGSNPLAGVTTQGGGLTVSVTGPSSTELSLTVAAPVLSVGGSISLTAGAIFNDGTITSSSGPISLTAATQGVIFNDGTITSSGGPISLTAGSGGNIVNE